MKMKVVPASIIPTMTRREALCKLGSGFGMVGLADLLSNSLLGATPASSLQNPLAVRAPHFPARAKHVIFLFLNRSEEHTSELQSPVHLVCRLLLEKKNK